LPLINFKKINDFGEYELYGAKKSKASPPKIEQEAAAEEAQQEESNRFATTTTTRTSKKTNDKPNKFNKFNKVIKTNKTNKANKANAKQLGKKQQEQQVTSISPTGRVRRGSTLRTHIPGCTCMKCRQARKKPNQLPTQLKFRTLGSEAKIIISKLNIFIFQTALFALFALFALCLHS